MAQDVGKAAIAAAKDDDYIADDPSRPTKAIFNSILSAHTAISRCKLKWPWRHMNGIRG